MLWPPHYFYGGGSVHKLAAAGVHRCLSNTQEPPEAALHGYCMQRQVPGGSAALALPGGLVYGRVVRFEGQQVKRIVLGYGGACLVGSENQVLVGRLAAVRQLPLTEDVLYALLYISFNSAWRGAAEIASYSIEAGA